MSSLRFFDRISRTWTDRPPGFALAGQYVVDGGATIGAVPVGSNALLVDDGSESVEVVSDSGTTARVDVRAGDYRSTLNACAQVADQVRAWRQEGAEWHEIVDLVQPLVQLSGSQEILEADPLETAARERLPQLRQVFLAPFTELDHEAERLPVSRARRTSRRAMQLLAARTEDWLKVGAAGVTPRVIESLILEERVDLYENRVAARLLDDLRPILLESWVRLESVKDLVRQHELVGWWRQQRRLATLWGSQPPDDGFRDQLERRRVELEELLWSLSRFRRGPLYEGVPRRAQVRQPIHTTNLLREDMHYRAVREVWAEWWRTRGEAQRPADRRAARLREVADFEEHAWLTIVSAMGRALGPHPNDVAFASHAEVAAFGAGGQRLSLRTCDEDGQRAWRMSVEAGGDAGLVADVLVVPLPCELLAGPSADVAQRLAMLQAALGQTPDADRIVLYPGTQHDIVRNAGRMEGVAHAVPVALPGGLRANRTWVLPVSPLDLESVERVERALRWYLLSCVFKRYPRSAGFPPPHRDLLESLDFVATGAPQEDVAVVGIATAQEERRLRAGAEDRARRLELLPRRVGVRDAAELRSACTALLAASRELAPLITCPVCDGDGALHPRAAATFEARCGGCEARWGLRLEPETDSRIPYLWAVGEGEDLPTGGDRSRWLGRDVLAEPCHSEEATYGSELINPVDGRCNAGERVRAACTRCAGLAT